MKDHKAVYGQLLALGVFDERDGEVAALHRSALEELELTLLDYLTLRDLLLLSRTSGAAAHAMLLAMFTALGEGSLCLPLEPRLLRERLARFAGEKAEGLAEQIIARLVGNEWERLVAPDVESYMPLVLHESDQRRFLYFHKYRLFEQRLEERLRTLLGSPPAPLAPIPELAVTLREVLEERPVMLNGKPMLFNDAQRRAVALPLLRDMVIISGGPGTGKTSIVVALLRTLIRSGIPASEIRMAAPTGRAAQRLSESLAKSLQSIEGELVEADREVSLVSSETLHRLLRYVPSQNRFRHHAGNPLTARVIIIDEVSMVDVSIMAQLLEALAPGTRLVLLGDKDQLPSIEAGAVLAELIPHDANQHFSPACLAQLAELLPESAPPPPVDSALPTVDRIVILRHTYRSQDEILQVARQINLQQLTVIDRIPRLEQPDSLSDNLFTMSGCHFRDLGEEAGKRWEALLATWAHWHYGRGIALPGSPTYRELVLASREVALDISFIPITDPAGELLSQLFRALQAGRVLTLVRHGPFGATGVSNHLATLLRPVLDPHGRGHYFAGCPIMVMRNDHQRGLYNGDVGIVLSGRDAVCRALFARGDGWYVYALNALPANELAFATTVHKSQGSEYDHVLLALPPVPGHRLLCKEILYTGLTRARTLAVICATPLVFQQALRRTIDRQSGLDIWHRPVPTPMHERAALRHTHSLPLFDS